MPDDVAPVLAAGVPAVPRAFGGGRLRWEDLPLDVRREVEAVAGSDVVGDESVELGFSPGLASRLTLANGETVFVKAAQTATAPVSADLHRAEARIATRLPSTVPAPRFLWGHGDTDWIVLAYESIDGRSPATPWDPAVVDRVLETLDVLGRVPGAREIGLEPAGPDLAAMSGGWAALQDSPDRAIALDVPWAVEHLDRLVELERHVLVACEGESIVHGDLRADNLLVTDGRVYVVDWPHARRGAAWLDLVLFLPSVLMQGVQGVFDPVVVGASPEQRRAAGAWAIRTVTEHPLGHDVHPEDLRAVVVGIAGYFFQSSRLAPPPGIPNLRAFQRGQGVAAVAWLEQLGL